MRPLTGSLRTELNCRLSARRWTLLVAVGGKVVTTQMRRGTLCGEPRLATDRRTLRAVTNAPGCNTTAAATSSPKACDSGILHNESALPERRAGLCRADSRSEQRTTYDHPS